MQNRPEKGNPERGGGGRKGHSRRKSRSTSFAPLSKCLHVSIPLNRSKLGGITWAALGRFLVISGLKGCPFRGMEGRSPCSDRQVRSGRDTPGLFHLTPRRISLAQRYLEAERQDASFDGCPQTKPVSACWPGSR